MKRLIVLTGIMLWVSTVILLAQTRVIPAEPQSTPIMLRGATVHVGNGSVIENAMLGFENGKITVVAEASDEIDTNGYQVYDLLDVHIYPGFIIPTSVIGLAEVSSVNATIDNSEQGQYNPNVRALVAYNTDSELIPTFRFNGILMAQTTPSSGIISGSSSIVQLDAWNWEDAAYVADDAIHMEFPAKMLPPRWWRNETKARKNENYGKIVQELRALFQESLNYGLKTDHEHTNLKLEAMQGLFSGEKALFIHAGKAQTILSAASMAKEFGVKRIVIVGGEQAMLVKDFLKEHKIPVILSNLHRLPSEDHEDTVYPYKLPQLLKEAGIEFCLGYTRGMMASARNLPFFAGTSVAYGLDYEDAVSAITLNTARILGIEDRVGSLEVGKDATLFVSEGDALDMRSNKLRHAFIQGREIQLNARQQFLYEKYAKKYGQEVK